MADPVITDRAIAYPQSPAADRPILRFHDIELHYRDGRRPARKGHRTQVTPVIDQVDCAIQPGEFVAIVGPSGCGKTTLLRMVSGLNFPSGGHVSLWGEPIRRPLSNVGIAFQNPVLLPWRTTLGNVLLPLEVVAPHKHRLRHQRTAYRQQARDLLTTVGLQAFENHYPWQLSGGMRQRASLCRALIHQPEILLLDEPFGALDAFTREEMWEMLQALWQRTACTALLVTHDLNEAVYLADRVMVMGPRPSRIIYEVAIELPRPRSAETCLTPQFQTYVSDLRRHIRHG